MSCVTNFDCLNSACCKNSKCVTNDTCVTDTRGIYIAIGLVGFGFVLITFIYFICVIKATRESVKKLREKMIENKQ